jgi:hypothetical protein
MSDISPVYTEMRDTLLAVSPETSSMAPTDDLRRVYGVLIDIGFEVLFTVAAYADGTTSVYNGNGGGSAGLGDVADLAMMSRAMMRSIEANLDEFKPVESTPLPAFGRVRFTVLTYDGRLGINADGAALIKGQHKLSKPFAAAMAIMERARQLTAAKAKGAEAGES